MPEKYRAMVALVGNGSPFGPCLPFRCRDASSEGRELPPRPSPSMGSVGRPTCQRNHMAEKGDKKNDDGKKDDTKKLSRDEYDRLVQGVDDVFFEGLGEPEDRKKPPLEKPASEPPKSGDGDK